MLILFDLFNPAYLFVGFNSFPAPESKPKVPRPMSVNPFTVSKIFTSVLTQDCVLKDPVSR